MAESNSETVAFNVVFKSEVDSINERRKHHRERGFSYPNVSLEDEEDAARKPLLASDATTPQRPTEASEVVGLALSGGGIRSSAFCLGVLQALNQTAVLPRVDYLSTVSGGGYIGASLAAGMKELKGRFPFGSKLTQDETPSLQHIRDYSNYLFPDGPFDLFRNAAIYARGLVANAILIGELVLAVALVNILLVWHPKLVVPFTGQFVVVGAFVLSAAITSVILVFLLSWSVWRSFRWEASELGGPWHRIGWVLLVLLAGVLFFELQVYILNQLTAAGQGGFFQRATSWIKGMIVVLTPLSAAYAFLSSKIGDFIKRSKEAQRWTQQAWGYAAHLSVYVAGAAVPILIWILSLELSFWGLSSPVKPGTFAFLHDRFGYDLWPKSYAIALMVCILLSLMLRPNANSLHALYRDRLSKAFLFAPLDHVPVINGVEKPLEAREPKLTDLSEQYSPYLLVNSALNVGGSKVVNRRGRNADFFLFSRNFVGSKTTGYVPTERLDGALTLGTTMAISGAAFSSNMGAETIKPLTATLALLNIRLGYWLRNPRKLALSKLWDGLANYYFMLELFGLLNERRQSIYLTDGGHIENLGIYELLRRRCKVIIAVDAEADATMAFGSFNVLVRYALIDLGVRIDLPWQDIATASLKTGKTIDEEGDTPKQCGPHVAIGEIYYPGDRKGILIYIKSSITGDENDYVFHYKKRYAAFPHETTLDQLFSEEQFEAYRALGFHAAYRFFDRRDDFAHRDPAEAPSLTADMKFLDQLFPLVASTTPSWPRPYPSFQASLAGQTASAAAAKASKAASGSATADIAKAAGRLAVAAEKATGA